MTSDGAVDALLGRLRPAFEDFARRSGDEVHRFRAGLKENLELEPILLDYPIFSSAETLGELQRLLEQERSADERESLRRFERICLDRRLEEETASEIVRLEQAQAEEHEAVDGQRQSFFAAQLTAAATGERDRRNRLALAHGVMCRRLLPSLVEKWEAQERAARGMGFSSYLEAVERVRDLDIASMVRQLKTLLEPSTARFRDRLQNWLGRTGIQADGRIEMHDLWHLWQADLGGRGFASEQMLPALEGTLEAMGLELSCGGRVRLDLESRPGKNPRAFCAPVEVPAMVHLVIQPAGGARDYVQLFHEAGHALHFASTDPELAIESKDATGYALTESYAFLFEHLVHDPAWLDELGGDPARDAHVSLTLLRNEYLLRRLTAEMESQLLSAGRPQQRPQAVADCFEHLIGFPVDPSAASFYLDDGLYAAEYARGFAFVARLREHLRSRWGRRFWADRRTGGFLRELWWTGNSYDTASMAKELWSEQLGFDAFLAELQS